MRILFGILIGLVAGFSVATWFYGHGGNVIVAGHALGPGSLPAAVSSLPAAPARSQPVRREPRVVVRDVTDEPANPPSPPAANPAPVPTSPAAGEVARFDLGGLVVILLPRL